MADSRPHSTSVNPAVDCFVIDMERCDESTDHSAVTDMEKAQYGDFISSSSIISSVSSLLDDIDNNMEYSLCERNEHAGLQGISLILDEQNGEEANFQSYIGDDTSSKASAEDTYVEKETQAKPRVMFPNNSEMWKPDVTWAPFCTWPPVVNQCKESNNLPPHFNYGNLSRSFFKKSETNSSFEEYNENESLHSKEASSNPERKIASQWQGYGCSSSSLEIGHASDKAFFQPANSFSSVPCAGENKEAHRLSSFSHGDNFDGCFPQSDILTNLGNVAEEEETSNTFGNAVWNPFLADCHQRKEDKYSDKHERQLSFQKESNENCTFQLMQPEITSAFEMNHQDYSEPSKIQPIQSTIFPTAQHDAGTFSLFRDQNRIFAPQNSIFHDGSNATFTSASSGLSNSPCASENSVDIQSNSWDKHPHFKKIDHPSFGDALGLRSATHWEHSATSPEFGVQPDSYEVESDRFDGEFAWRGLQLSAQGQHMNYQASQLQPRPPCYSKNIDAAQGHMDLHAPISQASSFRNQLYSADKSIPSHRADEYPHSQMYTRPDFKVKPFQYRVLLPDARALIGPGLPETQFSLSASLLSNPLKYYLSQSPPSGPFGTTNMMAPNCTFSFLRRKYPREGVEVTTYLPLLLDSCYEQWKSLEKERKKAEVQLAEYHPGRNLLNSNIGQGLRLPPNPSKIDRLIVDQLREQAKVASLFGKMEHLWTTRMCTSQLPQHLKAIHMLQASRKEEIDHASRHVKPTDVCSLNMALNQLRWSTRFTRIALWSKQLVMLYLTKTQQVLEHFESQN